MSIGALFSGSHYGSPLADVAQASMRPTFELQFSILQNQVINRLNKEIETANESTGRIDAFLLLEKERLERVASGMTQFKVDTSRNHNLLADVADVFQDLNEEVAKITEEKVMAAVAGEPYEVDPARVDALLSQINASLPRLVNVDGSTTGIIYDDGTQSLKNDGLLRYTDGDGASHMATQYTDFPSWDAFVSAMGKASDRLFNAQTQTDLKIDTVVNMEKQVGQKITEASLDIQVAQTASQAEKTAAVAKLKDKYSQMLNALSIGFEGAAAQSEYFAKHLLAPQDVDKGSVMNLFT